MKLRNVLAAFAASAVAASAMAISAFAASVPEGCDASSGMFACLLSDDSNVPLFTDPALVATVTKVSVTVECKDRDFEASVASGSDWYGGGFGVNSPSTGWDSHEWAIQPDAKELQMVPTDTRYQYKVTWDKGSPIFSASDTYAQAWIQDWSSSATFTLVSYELLNADGVDIRTLATNAPAEPVESTEPAPTEEPSAPTEEPAEATEEPADMTEESVEPAESAEPTEEPVDITEEPVEPAESAESTDTQTPATTPSTDSKGSPNTGVAGIAAAAGVAALAGVAVVVARKRK